MPDLILGTRRSGKTTELIKRSARDGLYILTSTKGKARQLFDQARAIGYEIPFPVTWEDFQRCHFHGSVIQIEGLLIDDLDTFVSYILKGIPVRGVTWNKDEVFDLNAKDVSTYDRNSSDMRFL